jgi:hypothetical protein
MASHCVTCTPSTCNTGTWPKGVDLRTSAKLGKGKTVVFKWDAAHVQGQAGRFGAAAVKVEIGEFELGHGVNLKLSRGQSARGVWADSRRATSLRLGGLGEPFRRWGFHHVPRGLAKALRATAAPAPLPLSDALWRVPCRWAA